MSGDAARGGPGGKLRAVVLGYHEIGCVGLEELLAHGAQVAAVFTHEDDPREEIWFRSVAEMSRARGIPTFAPGEINHPEWVERIRACRPSVLFSFYYRRMVRDEILAIPPMGCLNLHGSLLPRYRGRAPVNWVLVRGETETGVTLHHMTSKPDAGDIVAQRAVPIDFEDTALTLHRKIAAAARALLRETLPLIESGTAPRLPQDSSRASYFGGRRPEDGRIDWSRPAVEIYNLVRAVTHPYPGAFTFLGGRKLWIWVCRPLPEEQGRRDPGRIVAVDEPNRASIVGTGEGLLRLDRVQLGGDPEGAGDLLPLGSILG